MRVGVREPSGPGSSMDRLGLTLITGPANAGKVALLLQRYLDVLNLLATLAEQRGAYERAILLLERAIGGDGRVHRCARSAR